MAPWKLVVLLILFLVPGGTLIALALATAKALRAGWDRLQKRHAVALAPQAVMAAEAKRSPA